MAYCVSSIEVLEELLSNSINNYSDRSWLERGPHNIILATPVVLLALQACA